jgi:hypothetical protein
MKWLKPAVDLRYNRDRGWTERPWVDRYWSRILRGEAPDDGESGEAAAVDTPACGVRYHSVKRLSGGGTAGANRPTESDPLAGNGRPPPARRVYALRSGR